MSMHVRVQSNRLARNGSVISVKSRLFLKNPASEVNRTADLCLLVKREDAYRGSMAIARNGPPLPPPIFIGKATI
jgi:hypothetical protein